MRELIDFVLQHPILLLLLVAWLVSGLASAASKSARRAQEQQQRHQRRERAAQARPAAPAAPQSAEDIARQLRQMLGLETEPARPQAAPPPMREFDTEDEAEAAGEEEGPRHAEPDRGDDERAHPVPTVGQLHEDLDRKRHAPTAVTRSVARHLGHGPTPGAAVRPLAAAHAIGFDPRAAARAIVALEVLGPPRALRPYDAPMP